MLRTSLWTLLITTRSGCLRESPVSQTGGAFRRSGLTMVRQKTDDHQEKLPTSQRTKCQRRRRCSFTIHVLSQTIRILTHFPKDPTVAICKNDVQTRAMPQLFEHPAQSQDHKPQNEEGGARPQHRYAAVVQGAFTNWQNQNRT